MPSVPRVVAMFGPCRGVVREIDSGLTVGRAGEVGLQLIDEKVSREHCRIEPAPGGTVVRDLGSRNGTWLNGKRLDGPAPLGPGDAIGVGESVLFFEPSFEALLAKDGTSTLVLRASPSAEPSGAGEPGPAALEKAGALALEAAGARGQAEVIDLLAATVTAALQPSGLAVLSRSGSGGLSATFARPAGVQLSVSRALVDRALRSGHAFASAEEQTDGESDDLTTRVRARPGFVLCAPLYAGGAELAALCLLRARAFGPEEIALAEALAAVVGPALRPEPAPPMEPDAGPVAESRAMREALELAGRAAQVASTVLVTGETGTGKEELARAIHVRGGRGQGPFVAVNCGAIPGELAESELFGHEKGAFTGAVASRTGVFEQADGGTLFLDEVGDLPPGLQVKLLRVLQDRRVTRVGGRHAVPVDVRVVAATHRDLEQAVAKGAFRDDLFWRLNVLRIHLPPLRERREDVLPLAERFLARLGRELGVPASGFSPEARRALIACPWPGNARQLSNAVERALVLRGSEGPIGLADLPTEVLFPALPRPGSAEGRTLGELVGALEREQVTLALRRAQGVKSAAAEALGISRPTLDRKIEEYEIRLFE